MKRTKKAIMVVLALILMIAAITGCRKNDESGTISATKNSTSIKTTAVKAASVTGIKTSTTVSITPGNNGSGSDSDSQPGDSVDGNSDDSDTNEVITEEASLDFEGKTIVITSWVDQAPKLGVTEAGDVSYRSWEKVQQKYNCIIEWKQIASNYVDVLISSSLAGVYEGDMMSFRTADVYPIYVGKGIFKELDYDWIPGDRTMWHNDALTWNGKLYGLAPKYMGSATRGVLYNYKMLERLGLPDLVSLDLQGQWDWYSFLDIAQNVTLDLNGDGMLDQWGTYGGGTLAYWLLNSNGVNSVSSNEGKFTCNIKDRNAINALSFLQRLTQVEKVTANLPFPVSFINGQVCMQIGTTLPNAQLINAKAEPFWKAVDSPRGPDVNIDHVFIWTVSMQTISMLTKYDSKDLVKLYCEGLTTWDPNKEDYIEQRAGFIQGRITSQYMPQDNAEYLYEIAYNKPVVTGFSYQYSIPGLNTWIVQNVFNPVANGQVSVSVAIDSSFQYIQGVLNSYN